MRRLLSVARHALFVLRCVLSVVVCLLCGMCVFVFCVSVVVCGCVLCVVWCLLFVEC